MAEIRTESNEEDLCTLYIGEQVVIAGLTRAEAEAVLAAYKRATHWRGDTTAYCHADAVRSGSGEQHSPVFV